MKRIFALLILTFLLCSFLFGCVNGSDQLEEDVIQKEDIVYITRQITHSEAGGFFGMKTFMETATIENVTYCFEKSVTEEDRVSCIEQTSKLLENIDTRKDMTICIYDKTTLSFMAVGSDSDLAGLQCSFLCCKLKFKFFLG